MGASAFSEATLRVTHFPLAISHVYTEVYLLIKCLCVLFLLACLSLKGSQLRTQKGKENYFPPLHSQTVYRCPQILMPLLVPVPNGLPCPSPGDHPNPGIKPTSFTSLALADGFFTISSIWEALDFHILEYIYNKCSISLHLFKYCLILVQDQDGGVGRF